MICFQKLKLTWFSPKKRTIKNVHFDKKKRFWTDSTISLSWIRATDKDFNTFIENRVTENRELRNISHWHYVETAKNSADLIDRQT